MFPVFHVHAFSMSFCCRCIWYLVSGNGIICSIANIASNYANGILLRLCGCFLVIWNLFHYFSLWEGKSIFPCPSKILTYGQWSKLKAKKYSFLMKIDKLHGWQTICSIVDNNESKWQITPSISASWINDTEQKSIFPN